MARREVLGVISAHRALFGAISTSCWVSEIDRFVDFYLFGSIDFIAGSGRKRLQLETVCLKTDGRVQDWDDPFAERLARSSSYRQAVDIAEVMHGLEDLDPYFRRDEMEVVYIGLLALAFLGGSHFVKKLAGSLKPSR